MARGLDHDVAGKAELVAQGEELGLAGIAGRVLALGRERELGTGAEHVAMRIHRTGRWPKLRRARVRAPIKPPGSLFEGRHGRPLAAARLFRIVEDSVGFDAPVGTAGETVAAPFAEHALVTQVGDPGLA